MLHADVAGEGPELVLLHGWGMHSGIWGDWLGQLRRGFRVTAVDLPGHGNSPYRGAGELGQWASAVLEVAPPRAWWLGWSLGGLVALDAADQGRDRFDGLLLLASTPKFVADEAWMHAVGAEVFSQFAQQLETDAARTLSRFLSLQVRHAEHGNETLRQLRSDLCARPPADQSALRAGLRFLQHCDMRNVMRRLEMPLLCLLGERDTLVPAEIAAELPAVAHEIIAGAGHAPFLSHSRQCTDFLTKHLLAQQEYRQDAAG
jgi:pimeloyl-[acyl-carrier protein] methyl ester esterase